MKIQVESCNHQSLITLLLNSQQDLNFTYVFFPLLFLRNPFALHLLIVRRVKSQSYLSQNFNLDQNSLSINALELIISGEKVEASSYF